MTHAATAVHALRLPLLAATALALALALGFASPAAATTGGGGFEPIGEGFVDPAPADAPSPADAPAPAQDATPPTGGVAAGFGGTAADTAALGALHALAAGLLALVTIGLAVQRQRVRSHPL